MSTKLEQIYLDAAELIAARQHEFSCVALEHVTRHNSDSPLDLYEHVMGYSYRGEWGLSAVLVETSADEIGKDSRDFRIMLLCMMAACCEDMKENL